jgi:UDP-3-O-[3-hydroxymyristoyl] glucosamine N-acyltransferase
MSGKRQSYTLLQLSELTQSELCGDPKKIVTGVSSLEEAKEEDISFLAHPRYKEAVARSHAGAVCISKDYLPQEGKNYLVSQNPSLTFQKLIEIFIPIPEFATGFKGIHPTAIIHPSAAIEEGVSIGPYSVIDQGCHIGKNTCIQDHVSIGPKVTIGQDCLIYAQVTIRERCQLGNRVILQPGAVIGSCGFGYMTDASGHHIKLQQLGIVILEDDVEIGANTTIDRARFKTTRIGRGTKIDNLVQIGHNVHLGPHNLIVSQTGIAGSVETENHVVMAGQTGVVGHIKIAKGVVIGARGGVSKSIEKSGEYAGSPVMPLANYHRQQVYLRSIEKTVEKVKNLERMVEDLRSHILSLTKSI